MIPLPDKKYNIIYADPAWTFKVYSDKGKDRSAENHYTVSSQEDMKQIPVNSISDKDCVLFMWATYPNLKEALELITSWDLFIRLWHSLGSKKIKKAVDFLWGLVIGQEPIQRYVC